MFVVFKNLVVRSMIGLFFVVGFSGFADAGSENPSPSQAAPPIVRAVKLQDMDAVQSLLDRGADVNAPQGDGATALHWAAYRDVVETVDLLIEAGANVNAANDLMVTPLALATANGNVAIVRSLLVAGASPNLAGETGVTPLMEAARTGSIDAVQVLLEFEADVNASTRDRQQTALMWAVTQRHPEVVRLLLESGADPHARTGTRRDLIMLDRGGPQAVLQAVDVGKQVDRGGNTALLLAAQVGALNSARFLRAAGAELSEAGSDGNTPLVVAAFSGQGEVASWLLAEGAAPDAAGAGYTALHAAVLRSDLQTVETLLAHGADPNVPMTRGSPLRRNGSQWALSSAWAGATPLVIAASYLELDIMRVLIGGGASHGLALPDGSTPLLIASGVTAERRLNRPLDHADTSTDIGDNCCERPEAGILVALELLLDAGADVNEANQAGDTAMHTAASGGLSAAIQLLADRGAELSVKNQEGKTPLELTSGRGGRRGGGPSPEQQAAGELLRKLGATN